MQSSGNPAMKGYAAYTCLREIIAIALIFALTVTPAAAHPPADLGLSYSPDSSELEVAISHPVKDPATHFVKEVKVTVNGREVNDSRYTSQPAMEVFAYRYPISAKPGDTIEVSAFCSITGMTTQSLTIPPVPAGTSMQPSTTAQTPKSANGLLPALGLLGVGLWISVKHNRD